MTVRPKECSSTIAPIVNPNRPMIDGAAIGVGNTLLRAIQASWSSAAARSSSVRCARPPWAVP